jgi:CheY-like chemotaxis protein
MLSRVFDLFAQADSAPDRAHGGLGIGLTLVRKLVELHRGTIVAHSDGLGKGSEFVVRLPLVAAAARESAESGAPAAGATISRRILIVEDNSDNRQSMTMVLQLLGHEVEEAPDGVKGVERAMAFRPQAALIDIGLPGMDGFQVAQEIRAGLGDGVMLIALTGYGQQEDRRRAHEAGFDALLVKPVEIEELSRVLAQMKSEGS